MNYKKWLTTAVTTCIASVALPFFAHANTNQLDDVMIVYKNNDVKDEIKNLAVSIEHTYENLKTIEGTFTSESLNQLKKQPDIKVIEKNPEKVESYETSSANLLSITPSWNINTLQAQNAWKLGITGKNVKIAVIDTGVAVNNSLQNVKRYSFVDDDPKTKTIDESSPYDFDGHGTFVSGIIAAGIGPNYFNNRIGVAPDVSLYSLKVFEQDEATMESLMKALEWSIENHIDIINMSLGTSVDDPILKNGVEKAYAAGITLVAAVGNDGVGKNVEFPARYNQVIAVSSISQNDRISNFSNTGSKVEFTAPGSNVYSLGLSNQIMQESGTSFSAPHVTGFLALLKQQFPDYTNDQLRQVLRNFTLDLGERGKDDYYGYGLIRYNQSVPEDVQSVKVDHITKTSATISFIPKKNAIVPAKKYQIFANNHLVASTSNLNYQLNNLTSGTTYKVSVKAVNSNNISALGRFISFTTEKPSASEQFIEKNAGTITSWINLIHKGKAINFKSQFAPLYSITTGLTKTQQNEVKHYSEKMKLLKITATSSSKEVKATNLKSMKTKKTTSITFSTAIKPSTLTSHNVFVISEGKNISGFTIKKDQKGKTIKLSSKSNLTKGNYIIFIDNKGLKTFKGKVVSKPIAIEFTVK
ncbi:S8 family serine peptidase [Rummeliibacillus sp. JY-2-4R]